MYVLWRNILGESSMNKRDKIFWSIWIICLGMFIAYNVFA